jgi:hypothetical protein
MTLSVMTKGMEDCLQIVEQILPYFTPEYVFTIRAISGMDEDVDIPILFSSVSLVEGDDGSQGDYATRKVNFATMQFVAKLYLYGPVKTSSIVVEPVVINIFDTNDIGKSTTGSQKLSSISVTAGDTITASTYAPSMTAGAVGATHAHVNIIVEPPIGS